MNEYLAIGTAIAKLLDALQHKIKSREDAQFFADVCSQLREIEESAKREVLRLDEIVRQKDAEIASLKAQLEKKPTPPTQIKFAKGFGLMEGVPHVQ